MIGASEFTAKKISRPGSIFWRLPREIHTELRPVPDQSIRLTDAITGLYTSNEYFILP